MSYTLYQGDCLDVLKGLADNSVDLAIIDPPYQLDDKPSGNTSLKYIHKHNDGIFSDICDGFDLAVLKQLKRLMPKFNAFIFCSNNQLLDLMQFAKQNNCYCTMLGWHKYNSVPFANGTWRQDAEWILHIREGGATFQGGASLKSKITRLPSEISKYGHPTEKPLDLIKKYMLVGSNEGDTVLDRFMGSGTTGHAAIQLKRKFIGVELRADYFAIAKKRIDGVAGNVADLPMFAESKFDKYSLLAA